MDNFKTKACFRKYGNGDILAVFPNIVADSQGNILSYEHMGQHGAASYSYVLAYTKPAKPQEYRELQAELQQLGYNLEIKQRMGQ